AGSNLYIACLDVESALTQQPVAQVAIDFGNALFQLLWRNVLVGAGELGILHAVQQPRRERFRMSLNQADEPVREHHDRTSCISSVASVSPGGDSSRDP